MVAFTFWRLVLQAGNWSVRLGQILIGFWLGIAAADTVRWFQEPKLGIWEDAFFKSPGKPRPAFGVAWGLYKQHKREQVVTFVEEYALPMFPMTDPKNGEHRAELRHVEGLALREMRDWTGSEMAFALAVQESGRVMDWSNMGAAFYQAWLLEQQVNPRWFYRSQRHADDHTLWLASECYSKAVLWDVEDGAGWAYDGYLDVLFFDHKRYKPFARYLLEVDRPLDGPELYALGKWSFNLEDWPTTAFFMSEAVKGTNWPIAAYNAGYAYQKMGNREQAILYYTEALHRDPLLEPARENLKNLHANAYD